MAKRRYPRGLPKRYRKWWDHPWWNGAKRSLGFRWWLNKNGYLTPNFRIREARSSRGAWVPRRLKPKARNHAFKLEKLRHRLNDKPIVIISWYRSKSHNDNIGGAKNSKHISAIATDHPSEWVDRVGRSKVMYHGNIVFKKGGMGIYPWGAVHFDNRGYKARWSDWFRVVIFNRNDSEYLKSESTFEKEGVKYKDMQWSMGTDQVEMEEVEVDDAYAT